MQVLLCSIPGRHITILSTLNSHSYFSVHLPLAAVYLNFCFERDILLFVSFCHFPMFAEGCEWYKMDRKLFPTQFLSIFSTSLICDGCSVLYPGPVAPFISHACLDDAGSLLPKQCVLRGFFFFIFVLIEKNTFTFSIFSCTLAIPYGLSHYVFHNLPFIQDVYHILAKVCQLDIHIETMSSVYIGC